MCIRDSLLTLVGLNPEPKVTRRGDDLADTEVYHPPKLHRRTSTHAGDIRYKNSADKETNKKTNKYAS